jgi:cyclopropane fatty-acyl-phospholipid synthase-like methyltransferase
MAKYIFQGADASLPMAPMINYMERSGFEIHSVENVTEHYRLTIRRWHDNWLCHKGEIVKSYGDRWFRIWHVFLAWAATVAAQGTAACFQVVSNKNRNDFDRTIWVGKPSLAERMDLSSVAGHRPTNGSTSTALD